MCFWYSRVQVLFINSCSTKSISGRVCTASLVKGNWFYKAACLQVSNFPCIPQSLQVGQPWCTASALHECMQVSSVYVTVDKNICVQCGAQEAPSSLVLEAALRTGRWSSMLRGFFCPSRKVRLSSSFSSTSFAVHEWQHLPNHLALYRIKNCKCHWM
jgi:hypothetical protein